MNEIIDQTQVQVVVTCETAECGNAFIAIPIRMAESGNVFCGVCQQEITNITP
jgi:hypothetical protein